MLSKSTLELIIKASDLASGVMRTVGGSIDNVHQKAKSLTNQGLASMNAGFQKTAEIARTGMVIGLMGIVGGLSLIGGAMYKASSEAQTMKVALQTSFQGNAEEAKKAQDQITAFAAKTPYQLGEVMNGFIKLKNMGLNPSEKALTSYGNTASAMGKDLNSMVEAVADAATGEFERLKEFGIRSSVQGDKVSFTFKGVTQTVGKNSKEIEDYLIKLGEVNFAGGMDAQSKTISGMFSTMVDTINLKLVELADNTGFNDFVTGIMGSVTTLVASVDIVKILNEIIAGFQNLKIMVEPVFAFLRDNPELVKAILFGLAVIITTLVVGAFVSMAIAVISATWPFMALGLVATGMFYIFQTNEPLFWAIVTVLGVIATIILATMIPALVSMGIAMVVATWPILLIIATIGLLIGAVYLIIKNWDFLKAKTLEVWENIKRTIIEFVNGILQSWNSLYAGAENLRNGVSSSLVSMWDGAKSSAENAINFIKEKIDWITGQIDSVKNKANEIKNSAGDKINDAGNFLQNIQLPQFATGTNYVPNDMVAVIHEGEAIVPKKYNPDASGTANQSSTPTSGITIGKIEIGMYAGTEKDKREIGENLADAIILALKKRQAI